jgi:polysaccharide pyruvyl transferase WcaK-like protein
VTTSNNASPTAQMATEARDRSCTSPSSAVAEASLRRPARILVENGGYGFRNVGDSAMLQVAVARLLERYSGAQVRVFTEAPDRLAELLPGAISLSNDGCNLMFQHRNLFGGLHRIIPASTTSSLSNLEDHIRRISPQLSARWIDRRMGRRGVDTRPMWAYLDIVAHADAVIATGGGYITDSFENHAIKVLETLRLAKKMGKPVVMFGQGLGPIKSPRLRRLAKDVLPGLDLIALREGREGLPLLKSLGVSSDRIVVTGDDAIELAYRQRPDRLGNAIGFNLRVANYSEVDDQEISTTCDVVKVFARGRGVEVVPVPISWHQGDSDVATLTERLSLDDAAIADLANLSTPESVIRQAGKCRLVVTGSYHAGVFALSQGIPVVGIAKSNYYKDKFLGLADQFGQGCEVIVLGETSTENRLGQVIQRLWESAENLRESLLEAAEKQIRASRDAYDRLGTILQSFRDDHR